MESQIDLLIDLSYKKDAIKHFFFSFFIHHLAKQQSLQYQYGSIHPTIPHTRPRKSNQLPSIKP